MFICLLQIGFFYSDWKLTAHEIVQLNVGERLNFCLVLKLGSVTKEHGLEEKKRKTKEKRYFCDTITVKKRK